MRAIDLTGEVFGRLTVVKEVFGFGHRTWLCCCECGTETNVQGSGLRTGTSKSCGCLRRELTLTRNLRHGHSTSANGQPSRTYASYKGMLARCNKPSHVAYENYGGRGISVCERWQLDFANFLSDMGERPEGKTLDRINVNGNYEPTNCKWSTPKEQQCNTRYTEASNA